MTVTKEDLCHDLRRLGLGHGDLVMFHSSYKAIGPIEGGPAKVIDALRLAVGEAGTVMAYVSWDRSPYHETLNGRMLSKRDRQNWPAFDPAKSGANIAWGVLLEFLRTAEGALRSGNPDASCAAVGAKAGYLTADHPLTQGYGFGSPFAKLCELKGKVLLLGAPLDSISLIHHAEAVADLPDKRVVSYEAPFIERGRRIWRRIWRRIEEFDTSRGVRAEFDAMDRSYLAQIGSSFVESGYGRAGRVGTAASRLFEAQHLVDFAVAWLESRFGTKQ